MRVKIIEPDRHFFKIDWKEIWDYRDLLFLLVRRDFISRYKQTVLGPLWFVIQPLLMTLVFSIIFGKFAKIPTDKTPPVLFYMCGLLAWDYFAQCLNGTATCLISNAALFKKVYFPRLIVPLSILISNLMKYSIQLVLFLCFLFYFEGRDIIFVLEKIIFLVPAIFLTAAIALGTGLIISALTVRFRDLQHLISFSIQLWMYGTPVIYPLSSVPESWRWVLLINPMTQIVEGYKIIFLGRGEISLTGILVSISVITAVFFLGLFMFSKAERVFVDTI